MIGLDFFKKIFLADSNITIFDVGAHHGDSVNEFLELFPRAKIYAFEPDDRNFNALKARYSGESRVEILNLAISNQDGNAILYRNNYDATHSLLPFNTSEINRWADASDFRNEDAVEIRQVTLDSFCASRDISSIDILKLDTQGGELMAFQGGETLLSQQAIGCIFCEVEFRPLYENQPLFWDISNHLISRKYNFVNIVYPKTSEMGILSWADAIYVNSILWHHLEKKHSAGKIIS